ncbi:DmpA/ArgJ-like protein [Ramaria rubella]|nr:DmpA/ArgJ-like protein [Ramaria rubella]
MSESITTSKPRIRDYGIIVGTLPPGKHNAITDVPGVQVGHLTVIKGEHGKSEPVIRTGITLVSPASNTLEIPRYAAISTLNGAGEVTGSHVIEEYGKLDGIIGITGTLNVGAVLEGLQRLYFHQQKNGVKAAFPFHLPTVAETMDLRLTDMYAFPLKPEDVLDIKLADGPVEEGNVGGGTGMMTFGFKGGIGTSSRLLPVGPDGKQYTLGVLVQANHGRPRYLTIKGIPVGQILWEEGWWDEAMAEMEAAAKAKTERQLKDGEGSIIVVVATDAPLLPHQLKRIAKRVSLGLGRQGAMGENFSGDIFIALSTSDEKYPINLPFAVETVQTVVDATIDTLFKATADAAEEAVLNALVAAETMTGYQGFTGRKMPIERVKKILQDHQVI